MDKSLPTDHLTTDRYRIKFRNIPYPPITWPPIGVALNPYIFLTHRSLDHRIVCIALDLDSLPTDHLNTDRYSIESQNNPYPSINWPPIGIALNPYIFLTHRSVLHWILKYSLPTDHLTTDGYRIKSRNIPYPPIGSALNLEIILTHRSLDHRSVSHYIPTYSLPTDHLTTDRYSIESRNIPYPPITWPPIGIALNPEIFLTHRSV